jgi:hypothetical protein
MTEARGNIYKIGKSLTFRFLRDISQEKKNAYYKGNQPHRCHIIV